MHLQRPISDKMLLSSTNRRAPNCSRSGDPNTPHQHQHGFGWPISPFAMCWPQQQGAAVSSHSSNSDSKEEIEVAMGEEEERGRFYPHNTSRTEPISSSNGSNSDIVAQSSSCRYSSVAVNAAAVAVASASHCPSGATTASFYGTTPSTTRFFNKTTTTTPKTKAPTCDEPSDDEEKEKVFTSAHRPLTRSSLTSNQRIHHCAGDFCFTTSNFTTSSNDGGGTVRISAPTEHKISIATATQATRRATACLFTSSASSSSSQQRWRRRASVSAPDSRCAAAVMSFFSITLFALLTTAHSAGTVASAAPFSLPALQSIIAFASATNTSDPLDDRHRAYGDDTGIAPAILIGTLAAMGAVVLFSLFALGFVVKAVADAGGATLISLNDHDEDDDEFSYDDEDDSGNGGSRRRSAMQRFRFCLLSCLFRAFSDSALSSPFASLARDNSHAPKDANKPFAIVFTDVQSSTALWARAPNCMSVSIERHHEIIRGAIKRTGGYEVKTVGDSFMVAFHEAEAAVRFSLDCQLSLAGAEWEPEINQTYYELEQEMKGYKADEKDEDEDDYALDKAEKNMNGGEGGDIDEYDPINAGINEGDETSDSDDDYGYKFGAAARHHNSSTSAPFNGIRVRIGIHYGMGDIRKDQISKGFDYYGTVVNTAARVEGVGHGGQILISSAVYMAMMQHDVLFSSRNDAQIISLGSYPLRGLDELVTLYQIQPRAAARMYPALRLDVEKDVDDDDDEEDAYGDRFASGAAAAANLLRKAKTQFVDEDFFFNEAFDIGLNTFGSNNNNNNTTNNKDNITTGTTVNSALIPSSTVQQLSLSLQGHGGGNSVAAGGGGFLHSTVFSSGVGGSPAHLAGGGGSIVPGQASSNSQNNFAIFSNSNATNGAGGGAGTGVQSHLVNGVFAQGSDGCDRATLTSGVALQNASGGGGVGGGLQQQHYSLSTMQLSPGGANLQPATLTTTNVSGVSASQNLISGGHPQACEEVSAFVPEDSPAAANFAVGGGNNSGPARSTGGRSGGTGVAVGGGGSIPSWAIRGSTSANPNQQQQQQHESTLSVMTPISNATPKANTTNNSHVGGGGAATAAGESFNVAVPTALMHPIGSVGTSSAAPPDAANCSVGGGVKGHRPPLYYHNAATAGGGGGGTCSVSHTSAQPPTGANQHNNTTTTVHFVASPSTVSEAMMPGAIADGGGEASMAMSARVTRSLASEASAAHGGLGPKNDPYMAAVYSRRGSAQQQQQQHNTVGVGLEIGAATRSSATTPKSAHTAASDPNNPNAVNVFIASVNTAGTTLNHLSPRYAAGNGNHPSLSPNVYGSHNAGGQHFNLSHNTGASANGIVGAGGGNNISAFTSLQHSLIKSHNTFGGDDSDGGGGGVGGAANGGDDSGDESRTGGMAGGVRALLNHVQQQNQQQHNGVVPRSNMYTTTSSAAQSPSQLPLPCGAQVDDTIAEHIYGASQSNNHQRTRSANSSQGYTQSPSNMNHNNGNSTTGGVSLMALRQQQQQRGSQQPLPLSGSTVMRTYTNSNHPNAVPSSPTSQVPPQYHHSPSVVNSLYTNNNGAVDRTNTNASYAPHRNSRQAGGGGRASSSQRQQQMAAAGRQNRRTHQGPPQAAMIGGRPMTPNQTDLLVLNYMRREHQLAIQQQNAAKAAKGHGAGSSSVVGGQSMLHSRVNSTNTLKSNYTATTAIPNNGAGGGLHRAYSVAYSTTQSPTAGGAGGANSKAAAMAAAASAPLSREELLYSYTFLDSLVSNAPAAFQQTVLKQLAESWGVFPKGKKTEGIIKKILTTTAAQVAKQAKAAAAAAAAVRAAAAKKKRSGRTGRSGSTSTVHTVMGSTSTVVINNANNTGGMSPNANSPHSTNTMNVAAAAVSSSTPQQQQQQQQQSPQQQQQPQATSTPKDRLLMEIAARIARHCRLKGGYISAPAFGGGGGGPNGGSVPSSFGGPGVGMPNIPGAGASQYFSDSVAPFGQTFSHRPSAQHGAFGASMSNVGNNNNITSPTNARRRTSKVPSTSQMLLSGAAPLPNYYTSIANVDAGGGGAGGANGATHSSSGGGPRHFHQQFVSAEFNTTTAHPGTTSFSMLEISQQGQSLPRNGGPNNFYAGGVLSATSGSTNPTVGPHTPQIGASRGSPSTPQQLQQLQQQQYRRSSPSVNGGGGNSNAHYDEHNTSANNNGNSPQRHSSYQSYYHHQRTASGGGGGGGGDMAQQQQLQSQQQNMPHHNFILSNTTNSPAITPMLAPVPITAANGPLNGNHHSSHQQQNGHGQGTSASTVNMLLNQFHHAQQQGGHHQGQAHHSGGGGSQQQVFNSRSTYNTNSLSTMQRTFQSAQTVYTASSPSPSSAATGAATIHNASGGGAVGSRSYASAGAVGVGGPSGVVGPLLSSPTPTATVRSVALNMPTNINSSSNTSNVLSAFNTSVTNNNNNHNNNAANPIGNNSSAAGAVPPAAQMSPHPAPLSLPPAAVFEANAQQPSAAAPKVAKGGGQAVAPAAPAPAAVPIASAQQHRGSRFGTDDANVALPEFNTIDLGSSLPLPSPRASAIAATATSAKLATNANNATSVFPSAGTTVGGGGGEQQKHGNNGSKVAVAVPPVAVVVAAPIKGGEGSGEGGSDDVSDVLAQIVKKKSASSAAVATSSSANNQGNSDSDANASLPQPQLIPTTPSSQLQQQQPFVAHLGASVGTSNTGTPSTAFPTPFAMGDLSTPAAGDNNNNNPAENSSGNGNGPRHSHSASFTPATAAPSASSPTRGGAPQPQRASVMTLEGGRAGGAGGAPNSNAAALPAPLAYAATHHSHNMLDGGTSGGTCTNTDNGTAGGGSSLATPLESADLLGSRGGGGGIHLSPSSSSPPHGGGGGGREGSSNRGGGGGGLHGSVGTGHFVRLPSHTNTTHTAAPDDVHYRNGTGGGGGSGPNSSALVRAQLASNTMLMSGEFALIAQGLQQHQQQEGQGQGSNVAPRS